MMETTKAATETTTAEATPVAETTATTATEEISANKMMVKDTEIAEGMVGVLFENLTGGDMVIDLAGPTVVDAKSIAADAKYVFVVKPGSYTYNGSTPGNATGISPGSFDAKEGQWVEVIIRGGEDRQITVNEMAEATEEMATEEATTEEATTEEATTEATETLSEKGLEEIATATKEATTEEATTEEATTEEATTEEATTEEATTEDLAPPAGKARVYYQNLYTEEYVIDFGDGSGTMTVPPGTSDYSSYRDFAPGKYNATVNLPSNPATNFDVEFGTDTSWVVHVNEELGLSTTQIYPAK
jgi:hypothetical protein